MIFIVCQRVILIYFSAKSEMVARLRGHERFFCHVRRGVLNDLTNYLLSTIDFSDGPARMPQFTADDFTSFTINGSLMSF